MDELQDVVRGQCTSCPGALIPASEPVKTWLKGMDAKHTPIACYQPDMQLCYACKPRMQKCFLIGVLCPTPPTLAP
jgi:hypothetical protein